MLYFDYSWFREQTCLIICPYGRLQSALIDADTVIIGYDEKRGEPRSKKTSEGGDCVDCFRCVSVCPTGIDIRRGLQMECIGCANCIDACDAVMEKLDRPKGLIRYDSHRGFTEGVRRSLVRPRVFLYGTLALVGLTVFASVALRRTSFDVRVLRPQGLPYSLVDGKVRNLYTVRIQNKTDAAETYFVEPEAGAVKPATQFIVAQPRVRVEGLSDVEVPVFAELPQTDYEQPFAFQVVVRDSTSGKERATEVRFRGP
ncbi:MAG: 4Fe-4S dicluster domain-containing protein [Candidatus Eisenbacteria bacterium]